MHSVPIQQVQHSPSVPSPSQLPPLKLPAGVTIQLPDGSKLELPAGSTLSGTPSQPPAPQLQFPQFFRVSQAGTLEPVPQQQPQEQQQQQAQAPNPPQPQLQVPIQMPSNPYRDAAASAFQYAASKPHSTCSLHCRANGSVRRVL